MTDLRRRDHPPPAPHGARPPALRPAARCLRRCGPRRPPGVAGGHRRGPPRRPGHPAGRRPPVPRRLQHQDVHRGARDGAAGRGQAQPGRHPRHVRARGQATGPHHPAVPCARVGMQREPVGDVWEPSSTPSRRARRRFNQAERVHRPHHLWHYSNLVFSMLGEVVARLDARPWKESLKARILDPLEMRRTTVGFDGHAQGYYVPPFTDVPVRQEPARPACAGTVRRAGQHRGRHGALVGVRRRPGRRGALARHPRGDVRAAGRHGPRALDRGDGSRFLPGPLRHPHVRRTHRRHARAHHRPVHRPGGQDRRPGPHQLRDHARRRRIRDHARRPGHRPRTSRAGALDDLGRPSPTTSPSSSGSGTPRAARSRSPSARGGSRPARRPARPQAGLRFERVEHDVYRTVAGREAGEL